MSIPDRQWWRQRVVKFINRPFHRISSKFRDFDYVTNRDWDVLVVYDACRYDLFEEVADISSFNKYERIKSPASRTPEWASRSFSDNYSDIVYVSGNSWVEKMVGDSFHKIISVWGPNKHTSVDHFARAEEVTEAALKARENYPKKRLVVHYGQPHAPFVPDGLSHLWDDVMRGKFPECKFWELYKENMQYVYDESKDVRAMNGRVVLTSDHGNLLGERITPIPVRYYEHPRDIYHKYLTTVPWAVNEGERINVKKGEIEPVEVDGDIKENLEKLGYIE